MKALILLTTVSLALGGCMRETERAQHEVRWNDTPAHILCQGYSGVIADAYTTGRIEFDATGRIDYVDVKTGRLNKVEGECRVEYLK